MPLTAAVIMVWMLTTLEWKELAAVTGLAIVSGFVYWLIEHKRAMASPAAVSAPTGIWAHPLPAAEDSEPKSGEHPHT